MQGRWPVINLYSYVTIGGSGLVWQVEGFGESADWVLLRSGQSGRLRWELVESLRVYEWEEK